MSPTTFPHHARVVFIAALLWSIGGQAATLSIPDFPLFLTSAGVPPNLILTLDDSGSMSRAFTPDLCGNPNDICDDGNYDSQLNPRYVKSADYNPIYYDPTTEYIPPVDANGNSLTTSFTAAYINGFEPAYGTVNLGTNYQPSSGLFLNTSADKRHEFMQHYSSDVACNTVSGTARCQYNSTVGTGVTTWVNMSSPIGNCATPCTQKRMPAYYYVYDGTNAGCTGADLTAKLKNNSCYDIKIVSATSGKDRNGDGTISATELDERQNFANWYSFYRTRNLMTVSAASLAMNTLPGTVRVAWQALNSCRGSTTNLVTSDCEGWQTTATNFSNAIDPFTGTQKTDFYTWLLRLKTNTSTPLPQAMERVGSYCATAAVNNSTDKNTRCRKNYHLMMTDGIWNVAPSSSSYGNYDSNSHTLPDGKSYSSQTPYKDGNSNSLADIAFYYWARDLVTSGAGSTDLVSASILDLTGTELQRYFNAKNDPATWQHLVNYTVGLGLTPFLTSTAGGQLTWGSNTYDGSYPAIVAGTKNWPTAGTGGPDGNVADLWHAAINSRGRFYNVEGPKQLSDAFQDIINTISSAADAGGGSRISTNVARTTDTGATAFVARFNADWSGTLQAIPLNPTNGTLDEDNTWWEAGVLIPPGNLQPPANSRKIFTRNGVVSQAFDSCSAPLKTVLDKVTKLDGTTVVDNLCSQRLAWLRGYIAITGITRTFNAGTGKWEATYTAPNHGFSAGNTVTVSGVTPTAYQGQGLTILSTPAPTTSTFTVALTVSTDPGAYVADENDNNPGNDDRVRYANFRDRTLSVLGDIVNSGTTYVHKDNFGYGGDSIAVGGQASYQSYVAGKANNPPVVYVGANDGMLHAFNAETNVANGGGKELFAYVPSGVYNNLSRLTDPDYGKSHKFFVDGTPTVGDVYLGSWKTYLVGGLRAGGKSIYALDISDPTNFSATDVKWEFNDSTDPMNPDDDMGLTFGQPQIAAVSLTQWAAIFGNGYNSTSGKAVLYIVDISSGAPIAKITVPDNNTSCGSALPTNGLSTPFAFDKNGDGVVDVIYAGDLLGHLWRFDNSSGSWDVGNGGDPLFTACSANGQAQSIVAQPKAALINGKTTVYVGTGRYLQADPSDPANPLKNDLINTVVQSFYSIIDESDDPTKQGTVPRDKLLPQTITQTNAPIGPYSGSRTVSDNKTTDPGYSDRDKGCYMDFDTTSAGDPSERITSGVLIKTFVTGLQTRVIFVTSTPTKEPCEKSGDSWLMEVNTNCGRLEKTPFGTVDEQGNFQSLNDTVSISGIKLDTQTGQTGLVNEITWIGGPADKGVAFKLLPGTTGKVESVAQSDDKEPPAGTLTPKRLSWEQIQ